MIGSWPQARTKPSRSPGAIAVVRSLRKGWKFSGSSASIPSSSTGRTWCALSLISAKGVTDPGSMPSVAISSSAEPKENRGAASCLASAFKSTRRWLAQDDQPQAALLVLQEEVLGVAAGHVAVNGVGFPDREDRRMRGGLPGDAERGEELVQRRLARLGAKEARWRHQGTSRLIHSGRANAAAWTAGL